MKFREVMQRVLDHKATDEDIFHFMGAMGALTNMWKNGDDIQGDEVRHLIKMIGDRDYEEIKSDFLLNTITDETE